MYTVYGLVISLDACSTYTSILVSRIISLLKPHGRPQMSPYFVIKIGYFGGTEEVIRTAPITREISTHDDAKNDG